MTFSKLLEFLEHELDVCECADQAEEKRKPPTQPATAKGRIPLSTTSGLMAKPVTCTFCKGPHSPSDCSVPMSAEVRLDKVREVKACFRCGRTGHRMAVCRYRKPCTCGRGYHILQLCKTGGVRVPDVTNPIPIRTPSHPSWNPAAAQFAPTQNQPLTPRSQQSATTSSARNADIKSAGVMMRTVCVAIGNITVRALCDTGATFTLMSSRLAAVVPKKVVGKRHLRIETLGMCWMENLMLLR